MTAEQLPPDLRRVHMVGIGGAGMSGIARILLDRGGQVSGSDAKESRGVRALRARGALIRIGHDPSALDLLPGGVTAVVTTHAAIPKTNPELVEARRRGIPVVLRPAVLAQLMAGRSTLMVTGTHGKTTTTAMLVWAMQQLNIPVSYSIGTTISFGTSGKYAPGSKYFIYECDEFDRNFLEFIPTLSLVTSIDYDHPDTYPTVGDYQRSFTQFMGQSQQVIAWAHDIKGEITAPSDTWLLQDTEALTINVVGAHNRANATLAAKTFEFLNIAEQTAVTTALQDFPGSARRFEKLADNLYTDYGHHPAEIAAMMQLAREVSDHVVLVYQPHQNVRQHQIRNNYTDCMQLAEQIYWLPTYLTREDPALAILQPKELTDNLLNRDSVIYADLNDELWQYIQTARAAGKLVLCMGAGTIDGWLRERLLAQQAERSASE